jgi:hypothetical protein
MDCGEAKNRKANLLKNCHADLASAGEESAFADLAVPPARSRFLPSVGMTRFERKVALFYFDSGSEYSKS